MNEGPIQCLDWRGLFGLALVLVLVLVASIDEGSQAQVQQRCLGWFVWSGFAEGNGFLRKLSKNLASEEGIDVGLRIRTGRSWDVVEVGHGGVLDCLKTLG